MTIDLESYEAGNERRVRLCSGALVLHDGAVAVERDFSEFGSVVVEVSAQLSGLPRSGLAAALSLVVERSTDGSSWETVDTLTFSASGTVRTTDASPAVYLRVRASGTVGLWGVSADAIPLTSGGGGGGSQPLIARTVLSDDQIKALPTTPVEVVPSQGANTIILPELALIRCDTLNNGYDNIDAGAFLTFNARFVAGQGSTRTMLTYLASTGSQADSISQLLAPFDDVFACFTPAFRSREFAANFWSPLVLETSDFSGYALSLHLDNQMAGDLTDGDPANSMVISVSYTVHDLSP